MDICNAVNGVERQDGAFLLHTSCADIKIWFVTEEIVRVRVSFDRLFDEGSYVLTTTAWPDRMDGLLGEERTRVEPVEPEVVEDGARLVLRTGALRLAVDKAPLRLTLYDGEGALLYRSLGDNPFVRDGNGRVTHYSEMGEDDCFYGFGEKGGALNKNHAFLRQRATDAFGYDPVDTDTLYKHIPFYIALKRDTRKAVGVFYHNFYPSVFNMGRELSNYWPRYSYWQADGGDIDLFLLGGGTVARVVDNYTLLTGRPALHPKRAFGYQGSSMFYAELERDGDKAVIGFADTVRAEGFPLDGFHLSSGYTSVEGKRCVFTWNPLRFPDPEGFFSAMNERGAQCVPNVKPGVLLCHPRFGEFAERDVFVKDSGGTGYAVGKWWGGDGAFWDFTKPQAREAWKEYLTETVLKVGTASVWNDNCEYDSLLDTDCRCDYDGVGGTLGQLRPVMCTLMCKLGADAVTEMDGNVRPYIVCRSGSAGIQRYAQTWCGDNRTGWKTLRYNIPIILGMGMSGQPHEGGDIGGFAGPAPEEELLVRWVQNGIFQPRFSIHSSNSDNTVTEPWMYVGATHLIRQALLLRYRLMPYLYSAAWEASRTGAPVMRPLVYEFQDDPAVYDESFEFLFGRDLLVANVLEPGVKTWPVYLPAGCRWYDCNGDFACYEGGQTIEVPVELATIPMFLRDGGIVPIAQDQPMSMERDRVRALRLVMAPAGERSYTVYDDDGVSFDFRRGVYRKTRIDVTGTDVVKVAFHGEGSYRDSVERVQVELIRRDRGPYWVRLGQEPLEHFLNRRKFEEADRGWYYSQTRRTVMVKYPNPGEDTVLTVSFQNFDLLGM